MKKIIFVFALLAGLQAISQDSKRVDINGKIIVESCDISGITIYNKSSNAVAISDENGEFVISVGLNDLIEVSALQFQNINFQVNKAIIQSKNMKILLIEEINELDEIIVSKTGLSGYLATDIKTTKTFNPKLDALYFGIERSDEYGFKPDNKSPVSNTTMNTQRQRMINGLNIVNVVDQLLLPLFRSKAENKKDSGIPEVPEESIKHYFGSEFLTDNFGIPKHRVEEFIRYVGSENFDFSLLNYGKEMEFLQLLHNKSLQFLNKDQSK
ncbi:carboxypeptidase-like regulatory domain-containing protein [Mariniflexile sp.]|uniref:carboxypeptidase-like regulatory domain-containing protein n=1 Tax=Mariniflexile sp. TaxID=1979402 RepID=UPI0040479086